MVDGQYIPNLFIAPEVRHDKTSYTVVEIDHEFISKVIFLPSADLFKKGCCKLQAKVCAQITG